MAWAPALRRLSAIGLLLAAALWGLARWMEDSLPGPDRVLPSIGFAPLQGPTDAVPFEFEYKGKRCEVRPVASYEITGLVVSHNDIRSFSDIYHDAAYRDVEFWSGPFTCYWSRLPETRFRRSEISNNHLITDRPEIREALEGVHRGDQVRLRGLLVDYRMEDWGDFWRRSSTTRRDALCEVVFLEELDVLERHRPSWHAAGRTAKALLVLFPLVWIGVAIVDARRGRSPLGRL